MTTATGHSRVPGRVLAVLLGLLHLPSFALAVHDVVGVPDVVYMLSFLAAVPLQGLALLVTVVALVASSSVRRSRAIWIVTVLGLLSLARWMSTYGSDWV